MRIDLSNEVYVGLVAINVQPPLSMKEATMVGCWWQPTTIVQCQSLVSLAATIVDKRAREAAMDAYK